MDGSRRRILLAVEPGVLEGALARLLSAARDDEVVELHRTEVSALDEVYEAAVTSTELPDQVRAGVVIMLPDTRGGAGTGTVTTGEHVHEVSIAGAERVIELLDQYVPRERAPSS